MTALLRRWRDRIGRHPSRDRLLEAAFDAGDTAATTAISTARHLRRCARCARRADDLRAFLDQISDAAGASFDEGFPPGRLRAQRTRIDRRLARAVGRVEPARVLAFPFRRAPEPRAGAGPGRWAAAAVAVGLALGMVAGQFVRFHRFSAPHAGAAVEAPGPGTGIDARTDAARAVELPPAPRAPLTWSEFEQVMTETSLLDTLEAAATGLPVTELASIDALTPHVPDAAAAIR